MSTATEPIVTDQRRAAIRELESLDSARSKELRRLDERKATARARIEEVQKVLKDAYAASAALERQQMALSSKTENRRRELETFLRKTGPTVVLHAWIRELEEFVAHEVGTRRNRFWKGRLRTSGECEQYVRDLISSAGQIPLSFATEQDALEHIAELRRGLPPVTR